VRHLINVRMKQTDKSLAYYAKPVVRCLLFMGVERVYLSPKLVLSVDWDSVSSTVTPFRASPPVSGKSL
jgi:hypothetical protein